ncbi:MAG: hypothetical protein Q8K32_07790 [Archangium sp.]|nr:hypothetical protein [Archangium sp.]
MSRLSTRSARRTRDWIVLVALIAAQVSAQTPDSIEEVGQSPLYYRLPWVLPTGVFHGGPSLVVDAVSGATRWGFRVAGGVALALARDPHHVLAFELGYAYRGAEDHLGSAGISFLFTPTDQVKDWNFTPGAVLSLAAIGGARLAEPTFGLRVAVGLRWVYSFEVAWELLPSANAVTHVLALTLGSWLVAW